MSQSKLHPEYLRQKALQDAYLARKNKKTDFYNGIYDRWENPVLTRESIPLSWRFDLNPETNPHFMERLGVNAVFNSGAIKLNGKYYLVARIEGNDRKSFFGVAESDSPVEGFHFWEKPILLPDTCPEETNVYDMRLTQHEDGWIYGVFCSESKDNSVNDLSAAVAAAGIVRTKDLKTWERLPNLVTKRSPQQRNVDLLPEFVNGKYAFYTRPMDDFIDTGSGGGVGFGPDTDIVALHVQQDAADVCAVIAPQAFLGNGHIVFDLGVQNGLHVLDVHRVGEVPDVLHIQKTAVGQVFLLVAVNGQVQQHFAVLFHVDDVGVEDCDAHLRGARPLPDRDDDIKGDAVLHMLDLHIGLLQIGADGLRLLRCHIGDDFQLLLRAASHDARRCGGFQPLHIIGVGHDDRLDILDHASAGPDPHPVREFPQRLPGHCGGIGHRDGFGAAHGRDEFFLQYLKISLISQFCFFHSKYPLSLL